MRLSFIALAMSLLSLKGDLRRRLINWWLGPLAAMCLKLGSDM